MCIRDSLDAADGPPGAATDVEEVHFQQVAGAEDALQPQPVVGVDHVAPGVEAGHLAEIDDALGGVVQPGGAFGGAAVVAGFGVLVVLGVVHKSSFATA